jgi:peptide/nickel transport system ATP-binding protein
MSGSLLQLDAVVKRFSEGGLFTRRSVTAVDRVSFALQEGAPEIFAIVGESGSGKSTLARMILGSETPSEGIVRFQGRDIATIRGRAAREAFMAQVQPVFQNPFEAFNPLTRIDVYLFTTARRFRGATSLQAAERLSDEALHRVGLSLAEIAGRFPHELSGGQLQRVAVARALIPGPRLIVADEPVSMVDASLRMSIVNLFRALRDELGVSIVYITHDLATTYHISDRIIIMQKGVVVESGQARAVLDAPAHPYSIALLGAVLPPDPARAAAMIGAAQTPGVGVYACSPNSTVERPVRS